MKIGVKNWVISVVVGLNIQDWKSPFLMKTELAPHKNYFLKPFLMR